jgi:3-methyl-2-oxobutanoate hydroxymethyltransferase
MDPSVAANITRSIPVATIGIGASRDCDGQVLVLSDMIGLTARQVPKFAKQYANLLEQMQEAVKEFSAEVRSGIFPEERHEY